MKMARLMHPKRNSSGAGGTGMSWSCKAEIEQILLRMGSKRDSDCSNAIITGVVGRGMSMHGKALMEQMLRMDETMDIIVIDTEREWQKVIKESREGGNEDGETDVSEKR